MFQESLEEPSEDHGVCNIRDLELIKTEDIGLPGEISRDGCDWVAAVAAADTCAASPADEAHGEFGRMDTFVYVDHEGVEVDATFAGDGRGKGVEEEVHEHGLTGADVAIEVEALGCIRWCGFWFWWFAGEEAGEERGRGQEGCGRGNGWGGVGEELRVEGLEVLDDAVLVVIGTECARGDERVVPLQGRTRCGEASNGGSREDGLGHGRSGGLFRDADVDGLREVSRCTPECPEDSPRAHPRRCRRRAERSRSVHPLRPIRIRPHVAMDEYLLLLLADSNLPTGSFVASSGLESYNTHGFLAPPHRTALLGFIHDSLHSYAHTALPVVADAHRIVAPLSATHAEPIDRRDPLPALMSLDAFYESITLNHIARRASTSQGVALLTLYSKAFAPPSSSPTTHPVASLVDQLKLAVRRGDTHGHLPLCWGVLTGALQLSLGVYLVSSDHLLPIPPDRAQHLALFLHARSLLSAAVRMNTIGPYLAQQLLLRDIRPIVDTFVTQCSTITTAILVDNARNREDTDELPLNGPANTWPLGEILAMRHDLQHSRIFNS